MNSVPVSSGQQLIPPGSSSHKPPRSCLPQNPVDAGWGGAVLSLPWGIPPIPRAVLCLFGAGPAPVGPGPHASTGGLLGGQLGLLVGRGLHLLGHVVYFQMWALAQPQASFKCEGCLLLRIFV